MVGQEPSRLGRVPGCAIPSLTLKITASFPGSFHPCLTRVSQIPIIQTSSSINDLTPNFSSKYVRIPLPTPWSKTSLSNWLASWCPGLTCGAYTGPASSPHRLVLLGLPSVFQTASLLLPVPTLPGFLIFLDKSNSSQPILCPACLPCFNSESHWCMCNPSGAFVIVRTGP